MERPECGKKPDTAEEQKVEEVLQHLDSLYGFAFSLTRNRANAEDLVQETALKACRSISSFKPGTNIKAWLFTILRNSFFNRYKREKKAREESLDASPEFSFFAEAYYSTQEQNRNEILEEQLSEERIEKYLGDEVTLALQKLPDDYREAVYLSDVQELSYQEISEVLGVPIGTVRSRIARGRSALQQMLWTYAKQCGILGRDAS